MITVGALTATLIVSGFLPLLVAACTQVSAPPAMKTAMSVVLAIATAVGATLVAGSGSAPWQSLVMAAFAALGTSGIFHNHVWKPIGATQAVAELTRGVGLR